MGLLWWDLLPIQLSVAPDGNRGSLNAIMAKKIWV